MKVIQNKATSQATSSKIDLEIDHLPKETQEDIKEEVGQYIVEATLLALGDAKSPVEGETFERLSKGYKKSKQAQGGSGSADLELSGSMKDNLDYRPTKDGIEIGVFGKDAPKADGHNQFSGKPTSLPQRRFLPGEGQDYKSSIQKGVEEIISSHSAGLFEESDFSGVESKADLYDVLGEKFPGMSKQSIKLAVAGNSDLLDMLIDLDLLEFF